MTVHIVLPAFNEAESLPNLLTRFANLPDDQRANLSILVINDGSTDNTREVAQQFTSRLTVEVVDHAANMGLGQAVQTGIRTVVERASADGLDDTLVAINGLGESDAFGVVIEGDATSEKPLGLAHVANSAGLTNVYHNVAVKSGANASIIDRYVSSEGIAHVSSAVVDLSVEKDATANWIIIQEENTDATRLARLNISLAQNAELNIFILNAGGKLVRQEINVVVSGENSNLDIKGVNLIGGNSHVDVTTVLAHNVPNTNSNPLFRNIMTGQGKGVFQGQIKVHQIAQKTDAKMACNTLLLSDDAAFYAKPELEIFADDVICGHGATVTELEDDHLFYWMARGIKERTARALLVEAFVDEVVEELENEPLIEALEDIIARWLEKNG